MHKIFKYSFLFILAIALLAFKGDQGLWKVISITEVESEVKKMESFYKTNTSYSVSISHASYVGHASTVPFEKIDGSIVKLGNQMHSFMLGIRTIQNEKYKIVIDTSSNTISVSDIDKDSPNDALPLGALIAKKNITACKKSEVSSNDKIYRIEFSKPIAYTAEEMKLGSDYRLKELIMYYRATYNIDPDDKNSKKEQPKVKIAFGEYKLNPKIDTKKEFSTDEYFSIDKSGKFIAASKYKHFEILDLRVSNHIK